MKNDSHPRPEFRHAIVAQLYDTIFHTQPACFEELLALPRAELIDDLENLLSHEIKFMAENNPEDEDDPDAAFHCLRLLGHLKSESSLPLVLDLFRLPADQSNAWMGDLVTEDLWDIPLLCGSNQLDTLVQVIKDVSVEDEYSKSLLVEAIEQTAYYLPEKRTAVVRHLTDLLHFFNALSDKAFAKHEAEFVVASIADAAANLSITEILPVVGDLFRKGRIDPFLRGNWIEYQKDFGKTFDSTRKVYEDAREWYDIEGEKWKEIIESKKADEERRELDRINKEKQAALDALKKGQKDIIHQVTGGKKIGRNEPCPCGSGKKFKKCHGA